MPLQSLCGHVFYLHGVISLAALLFISFDQLPDVFNKSTESLKTYLHTPGSQETGKYTNSQVKEIKAVCVWQNPQQRSVFLSFAILGWRRYVVCSSTEIKMPFLHRFILKQRSREMSTQKSLNSCILSQYSRPPPGDDDMLVCS